MDKIFSGIVVLDLSNNVAGPLAASMLADYGAEVIKVEKPQTGDDMRAWGPFLDGESFLFMWHNRGKKSIVLDMKEKEDLKILKKLIQKADVLIESYKPGVMAKFDLDFEKVKDLNPALIMCSVSAFGQTGPYKSLPGYDLIAQAMSGIVSLTGNDNGPPMRVGVSIADYVTGFNAFAGISAGLFHKARTGQGQYIDVSLLECMQTCDEFAEIAYNTNQQQKRLGNHHGLLAPYGIFNGRNGNIVIAALNPKLWGNLTKLMGRPELADKPGFQSATDRCANLNEVISAIEAWLGKFADIGKAEELLAKNDIPCARIRSVKELANDPHLLFRNTVTEIETPGAAGKTIKARGVHLKFSKTPGSMGAPPKLDEHRDEILKKYCR